MKPKEINSRDIWPCSKETRLMFSEFDLSDFGVIVTTPYRWLSRYWSRKEMLGSQLGKVNWK